MASEYEVWWILPLDVGGLFSTNAPLCETVLKNYASINDEIYEVGEDDNEVFIHVKTRGKNALFRFLDKEGNEKMKEIFDEAARRGIEPSGGNYWWCKEEVL